MDNSTSDAIGDPAEQMATAPVSSENVRIRVSTWLSGLVEEVRRKSPIHRLSKWNDVSDNCGISKEINIEDSTSNDTGSNHSEQKEYRQDVQLKRELPSLARQQSNDENIITTKNFWSSGNFFSKVRSFDRSSPETEETPQQSQRLTATENLRSLGKAKINEFYDKVRANKLRYNSMLRNSGKMDNTSTIMTSSEAEDSKKQMTDTDDEDDILSSTRNSFTNAKDELSLSDINLAISEGDDISFNFTNNNRKMPLKSIGRSSTSYNSSCNLTNSLQHSAIAQQQSQSPPIRTSLMQKNHLLGNIGRSFSEHTDDDENINSGIVTGSCFMPNERSRSYSHAIGERPCTRNTNNNNNNSSDNVCSSLPTFFDHKSIPVSPVPHYKDVVRSREPSLSDISSGRRSLLRDSSVQSDSSHCSSVESLLEARKPDPEAILCNLGFGPVQSEDVLSKIPKRFLKPSQVKGIDIETFLRQQQMSNHLHDHSVLGYRGLLGNPDIPPSFIVAKIMERFEQNERNRCIIDINMNRPQSAPPTPGPNQ